MKKLNWQGLIVAFLDAISVCVAYFLALYVRFEFSIANIEQRYIEGYLFSVPVFVILTIAVFTVMKLYRSIWRYVGITELIRMVISYLIFIPAQIVLVNVLSISMPRSYYAIGYVVAFVLQAAIRLAYRLFRTYRRDVSAGSTQNASEHHTAENILLIGAGDAGQALVREISQSNKLEGKRICCAIDDNPSKHGKYIGRVKIIGGREKIQEAVDKYDITHIYLAIPSISGTEKKKLLDICKKTGCKMLSVPGVYQFINGDVSLRQFKEVKIEDLLGREPITIDDVKVNHFIAGKTVLVTGGGGSIGSELCRQIAKNGPQKLIIFDIYENNAYGIQNELIRDYPGINLSVLIGSVRDEGRVDFVFRKYKPDLVFHAAAHKHVPLMEQSPNEAVKNNCGGTYICAKKAIEYGTKNFILISTDKAVFPTSLMGASKRICEMIMQRQARASAEAAMANANAFTKFSAVRFGNVLGSNGSVIPVFKEQIERGGPVTVTHKDIIRYFMTIPEAVSLVLQASLYAQNGEIFVLDMGEPVKIYDLAENMILLSGKKPHEDIEIKITGLRPGEKLFEELLMSEEGLEKTENNLIYIASPIKMDDKEFDQGLEELLSQAQDNGYEIKEAVQKLCGTYNITDN